MASSTARRDEIPVPGVEIWRRQVRHERALRLIGLPAWDNSVRPDQRGQGPALATLQSLDASQRAALTLRGSVLRGPSVTITAVDILELILWVLQFGLGIGLIFLVLVHSGRGGGLSDMFGGGLGASAAGSTVMEKNLDRITVLVALAFAFNTLIMALVLDT